MKKSSVLGKSLLTASLIAGLTIATSASAATWRGWNTHATGYPNTVALEHFAKTITEETDGRVQAKVYNSAVLGDQIDAIQQVISGALQFANFNLSPMGQFVPKTNIVSLPFLFKDVEQQHHVMDGPIGDKLAAAMAEKGLVALSWFDSGARSFYNSKHPIRQPADLKGLKFRVQENDLYVSMVEALGGNPTPMPFGAVYQSLASGVIDGAENNYPSYKETNHFEVAKYYTQDRHFIIPECLCIAEKAWDKLSDEDQATVRKAAVEAAEMQHELWAEAVHEAKDYVAANGAEIIEVDDITAFQDAMKPVYDKFYKQYPDQEDMVEAIRNTK